MTDRPPRLRCRDMTIGVGHVVVTRALDLTLEAGQCWAVLGRNGVGKTTLLHTLAGLRPPASGNIEVSGVPLRHLGRRQLARRLGILFQDHEDSFPATVMETVLQGRHPHLRAWQWERAEDHQAAAQAIRQLGLEGLETRNVQTLSGGERQRVGVATLLAQGTDLLLLDEPTNHLDLQHQMDVLDTLVTQCRNSGAALLMVLHDINLAARFCDHALLLLGDGESRHGPGEQVLDTPLLERLYGYPLQVLETDAGPAWLPR